jgi:hypothetical protein
MRTVGVGARGNWVYFNYCARGLAQVAGLFREICRFALVPLEVAEAVGRWCRRSNRGPTRAACSSPHVCFIRFLYYNTAGDGKTFQVHSCHVLW